eukprot:23152_3
MTHSGFQQSILRHRQIYTGPQQSLLWHRQTVIVIPFNVRWTFRVDGEWNFDTSWHFLARNVSTDVDYSDAFSPPTFSVLYKPLNVPTCKLFSSRVTVRKTCSNVTLMLKSATFSSAFHSSIAENKSASGKPP